MEETLNGFKEVIDKSEAGRSKVSDEYRKAHEYYENSQAPSNVPSDKDYIQENIITDTIDRAIGELIAGEIKPEIVGGGAMYAPVKELFEDILEANDFKENVLTSALKDMYTTGLGSIKFIDNPYKRGRYGIGFPEIVYLDDDESLLDTNCKNGKHTDRDDIYKIHKTRKQKDYVLKKWGYNEKNRKIKKYHDIQKAVEEQEGDESETFVNIYEVEYKKAVFRTKDLVDENGQPQTIREETDAFFITKILNEDVMLEEPEPTGYPTFRKIDFIHTERKKTDKGKNPMGIYVKQGQTQDQLNITSSVMLEAVKSSIKQGIIITGITDKEEENTLNRKLASTNFSMVIRNPNAKVHTLQSNGIDPSLLQWHAMSRERYDDIHGSSNQAQQFQSASKGQLSGKAIGNLQVAGTLPEYIKKNNIESSLKQLSKCIFHYIKERMNQPFEITRKIDGKERQIQFNKQADENTQEDDFTVVNDKKIINDLSQLGEMDVKLIVNMNALRKMEYEMNKAIAMANINKISDIDLLKALYPNSWKEKYDNLLKQNKIMELATRMVETGGDELVQMINQVMDKYEGKFEEGEFKGDPEDLVQ
ncbi:MAG: hypothetical protein GF313_09405 [Caldithrix sp.]|nr:hypothetical protein [Caldithrix sp.]